MAAVRYPIVSLFEPGSKNPVFCTPLMRYREFSCAHTVPSIRISISDGIEIDRELTTEQFEKIEDYFRLEVGIAQ